MDDIGTGRGPQNPGDTPRKLNRNLELQRNRGIRTEPQESETHWWTEKWFRYIESIATPKEIASARTYVRAGKVVELQVLPGLIEAKVAGRRKNPYHVKLHGHLPEKERLDDIKRRLMERALYAALLLAGKMSVELEDVFAGAGVDIVPWARGGGRRLCSCSSYADDCKHILAVLYVSAGIFDRDPFLLLKMRGLEKDALFSFLSAARGGDKRFDETAYGHEKTYLDEDAATTGGFTTDGSSHENESLCDALRNLKNIPSDDGDLPESGGPLFEFPIWCGETSFRESIDPYYASVRKLLRRK